MNYIEYIKILDNSGFFWSFGKHPEFEYECTVYYKTGHKIKNIKIFIGNTLEKCLESAVHYIDDVTINKINS